MRRPAACEVGGPLEPQPGRLLGLELVRGHDRRAPVEAEVAHLRVHEDGHAAAPREGQDPLQERGGDDALLVVGDDEGAARGELPAEPPRRAPPPRAGGTSAGVLAVGPHHLLAVGDDARLHRRRPVPARARRDATRRRPRRGPRARARRPRPGPRRRRGRPRRPASARSRPRCRRRRGGSSGRSPARPAPAPPGEMRDTRPQTNSSSITSPSTRTRRPRIDRRRAAARADGEEGHDAQAAAARPWRRANGTAVRRRTSIRTSESPRLYSKRPAAKTAARAASTPPAAPPAPGTSAADRRASRIAAAKSGNRPPQEEREAGQPALGRDLQRVVVQVGLHRVRGLGPPVARVDGQDHPRALPEDRLVEHHVDARLPHVVAVASALVAEGQPLGDRRGTQDEDGGRRRADEPQEARRAQDGDDRETDHRADPRAAGLRDDERPGGDGDDHHRERGLGGPGRGAPRERHRRGHGGEGGHARPRRHDPVARRGRRRDRPDPAEDEQREPEAGPAHRGSAGAAGCRATTGRGRVAPRRAGGRPWSPRRPTCSGPGSRQAAGPAGRSRGRGAAPP